MVVVGLASLSGQTAMLTECRAWDSVPKSVINDPFVQQENGRYVDPAVQQAGYYHSRPRQSAAAAGIQQSTADRSGALFRGQKVKVPELPFGRQAMPTAQPSTQVRAPQSPAANMSTAARLQQQRVAAQTAATNRSMPQGMPLGTPTAIANQSQQAARMATARPLQSGQPAAAQQSIASRPAPQRTTAQAAPGTRPVPNSTSVSPWQMQQQPQPPALNPATGPATTLRSTPSAAPAAAPRTAAAQPVEPVLSPADRLVADAHEVSTRAECEEDYTHIIETCRRAQASQASPETNQYAKNLIAWALNRRGQLKAEDGNDKEAMLDFDDALRTDAGCWRALHNRGVLFAQAGQFEKAFDDFTQTIQLNPQFAKAYSNRAALYMVADNLEAALADYRHAIEMDPNLSVAHRGCGRVCQLKGRIDEACAHYDAAVQLAPDDSYAAACRADLLTDIGRYSEAVAEYERAMELDPASSQARGGSAWLLATCPDNTIRDPELAIERAQSVIEQGGDEDALNFDTLAAAQASAGDFAAAMDSVRQAIELAPIDERDAYKDRLLMYQQAKPYRIAPIERAVKQVNYETTSGVGEVAQ
jgi:tetratricopeptide (TPR) repeat protein